MSTIAYGVAITLIGTTATVASQIALPPQAPVESRMVLTAVEPAAQDSDLKEFVVQAGSTRSLSVTSRADTTKTVHVAAVGQEELRAIVRDEALAQKADDLASAATDRSALEDENFIVETDEVEVRSVESPAIVPLPKARPAFAALETRPAKARKTIRREAVAKRKRAKRGVLRVAEANTSRQSKLARRLRSKGWLIGAFR